MNIIAISGNTVPWRSLSNDCILPMCTVLTCGGEINFPMKLNKEPQTIDTVFSYI